MQLKIKPIEEDCWGRSRFQNVDNKRIYAVVDGVMYSTSKDGEPDCPLRSDLNIIYIEPQVMKTNKEKERHDNLIAIANQRGSLLEAIEDKDQDRITDLERRAKNGEIIRLM